MNEQDSLDSNLSGCTGGSLEAEQIRVFEDREAARFYALELAKTYDYINMYESEVTDGFSR